MTTPTTIDTDTELSAVNSILGAIGQSPITTIGEYSELVGETKATGNGSLAAYTIGITYEDASQIQASLDGVKTTAFTVSGTTLTFSSAPANNVAIRIFREQVKYNTLENPEISFIYTLLKEVNTDVQNEGWIFNIERHVSIDPDTNKRIKIPANVLRYDLTDGQKFRNKDLVRRTQGGITYLYDTVNHTYDFDDDVELDIVYLWPYEDLPSVFKRYIVTRASVRAATQLVSNPNLVQLLQQQEGLARANCTEYECNQGDHNFMGFDHNTTYQSYQPYNALRR